MRAVVRRRGLSGMRRVRERSNVPLATNTVVVNFEQLAANALATAGRGYRAGASASTTSGRAGRT